MEGDIGTLVYNDVRVISIHSLRMEGDPECCTAIRGQGHFNPLPPHGGRQSGFAKYMVKWQFQSTPSAWRETGQLIPDSAAVNFNPLPPHGGRPFPSVISCRPPNISIHSLRMEGDRETVGHPEHPDYFNPLPPHGGRRAVCRQSGRHCHISIHSLRMEGDRFTLLF